MKSAERKHNFKAEIVGRKNSVNWNHTELILNCNQSNSDLIHVDPNHTDSNQTIQSDSTNIRSIHDSYNIFAMEKILHRRHILQYTLHRYLLMGMQVTLWHHKLSTVTSFAIVTSFDIHAYLKGITRRSRIE